MRIQYCSDLHLEFPENQKFSVLNPLLPKAEILILAGDIIPLNEANFRHPFFQKIATEFRQVFWIPGNHEFYHRDICEFGDSINIKIADNIHLVNNVTIEVDDISFIFTTLWSNISAGSEKLIEQSVSDFSCILKSDRRLRAIDFNKLHNDSLAFLEKALAQKKLKSVVATHHLPSPLCNYPPHSYSLINEAFCVDISNIIEASGANFWIYGHSHFNQKPIIIGKTMLLTNQLGYVHCNETAGYRNDAFFVI